MPGKSADDRWREDEIRKRLRQAREKAKLSRKNLGAMLTPEGRTETAVQQYETGIRHTPKGQTTVGIPFELLDDWADATGTSKWWLLTGEELIQESEVLKRLERIESQLKLLIDSQRSRSKRTPR